MKVLKIESDYMLNSHGTSGSGYVEHRGLKIELNNGETLSGYYGYSSKAHGTWHETKESYEHYELNGRLLPKYDIYINEVRKHFNDLIQRLEKNLLNKEFTKISEIRKILKNGGY